MSLRVFLASLVAVFLFGEARAAPVVADLLAEYATEHVQISPSGAYLAVVRNDADGARFDVFSLPDRKSTVSFNIGKESRIHEMHWVSDHKLVVKPGRRMFRDAFGTSLELMAVDARGGKTVRLAWNERNKVEVEDGDCAYCGGDIIDTLPDDDDHILVHLSTEGFHEAFRVNLSKSFYYKLARRGGQIGTFVAGAQGDIAFSSSVSKENFHTLHVREGTSDWRLLASFAMDEGGWEPIGPAPGDGKYFTLDGRQGTNGLGLFDLKTNAHQMLFRVNEVDITRVLRDHDYRAYAVRTDHHYPAIHFLDNAHPLAVVVRGLQKQFPDDTVTLTSATRDGSQAVALIEGDRNPGRFVLVNVNTRQLEVLFERLPGGKSAELAPMAPFEVKTRDGATIYGYMTSAPSTPKPGPLVVMVHGGPHGVRDYWGFDAEVQALAATGVHVLQVNYRGSGGYGLAHQIAGFGEWGGRMQDDVTDATRWAIENGTADPQRICIYGASYGAYSALMGVAREPDLYRCAVGFAGVYDLTIMEGWGDIGSQLSGVAYLERVLGTDMEKRKARSPVNLAAQIKAPVLLIHGGRDQRAPIIHGHRMREALEDANKPVEWFEDTQQGHGFFGTQGRLLLHEKVSTFIGRHLGLAAAAAAAPPP